jgi:hypothetical protein
VGALGDKVRPATSYITVACVGPRRYFDLDAERTPSDYDRPNLRAQGSRAGDAPPGQRPNTSDHTTNPAGAPLLDWWEIPTSPYRGSHYATMPPEIPRRLINLMCPARVCGECGEPSVRLVDAERLNEKDDRTRSKGTGRLNGHDHPPEKGWEYRRSTVGWSDCGHAAWRRGVVLDPFAGSGTTLAVATQMGRDSIGIDIDQRNVDLAYERVGIFLDVA